MMQNTLKYILALIVLASVSVSGHAQEAPNDDDILRKTMDPASPYNHKALMFRFNAGDTTLTVTDYYYLYYGYTFTDSYRPLVEIPAEKKITETLKRQHIDKKSARDMIVYGTEVMESDPFSPLNLNCMAYAYGMIGDTISATICYDRYTKVMDAIRMSGNGLKEDSPIHIIRYQHADDIVRADGYEMNKRLAISDTVGYIAFKRRSGDKAKGYFFDYSRVLKNVPEELMQRPRGWQFNNLPVGGNK